MKISQTESEHEARTIVQCCHQMRIADPTKVSFHLSKGQRRIDKDQHVCVQIFIAAKPERAGQVARLNSY